MCSQVAVFGIQIVQKMRRLKCYWRGQLPAAGEHWEQNEGKLSHCQVSADLRSPDSQIWRHGPDPPPDPGRDEHFKSFTSSSQERRGCVSHDDHHQRRGEVVCQELHITITITREEWLCVRCFRSSSQERRGCVSGTSHHHHIIERRGWRAWRWGHDSREEGGFENLWTIGDSPCMPSRGHFQPCSGQLNKLLCLLTFTTRMFKPRNYFLKFWQTL